MIDHARLGRYRRNLRDYSVHQRSAGKDAGVRLREKEVLKTRDVALIRAHKLRRASSIMLEDDEDAEAGVMLHRLGGKATIAAALCQLEIDEINTPFLNQLVKIGRKNITFDTFPNQKLLDMTGFGRADLCRVHDVLHIPLHFSLNHGRHSFRVSGVHAILYFLFRLHSPQQRQTLDTDMWGYDYSVLSKIFTAVECFLDNTYRNRLRIVPEVAHKFPIFNKRICDKLMSLYQELPPEATRCALFADGCRYRTSRPEGGWFVQAAAFSGDKWFHNHGILGCCGPDGMIYDLFDGPVGRRTDKHFMRMSRLNTIMRDCQLHNPLGFFWIYTDKGFTRATHVRCAHHGPAPVTEEMEHHNWIMSRARVGVEWGFGKVKARCPFSTRPSLLKLKERDVARIIRVCVLMTNIHTCLHQSQTGLYFECLAPSLEEYMS